MKLRSRTGTATRRTYDVDLEGSVVGSVYETTVPRKGWRAKGIDGRHLSVFGRGITAGEDDEDGYRVEGYFETRRGAAEVVLRYFREAPARCDGCGAEQPPVAKPAPGERVLCGGCWPSLEVPASALRSSGFVFADRRPKTRTRAPAGSAAA